MAYDDKQVKRKDQDGLKRESYCSYNKEIDSAKNARDNQFTDSDPMVQKEGFLGVDDLDKMRRRKIR